MSKEKKCNCFCHCKRCKGEPEYSRAKRHKTICEHCVQSAEDYIAGAIAMGD